MLLLRLLSSCHLTNRRFLPLSYWRNSMTRPSDDKPFLNVQIPYRPWRVNERWSIVKVSANRNKTAYG